MSTVQQTRISTFSALTKIFLTISLVLFVEGSYGIFLWGVRFVGSFLFYFFWIPLKFFYFFPYFIDYDFKPIFLFKDQAKQKKKYWKEMVSWSLVKARHIMVQTEKLMWHRFSNTIISSLTNLEELEHAFGLLVFWLRLFTFITLGNFSLCSCFRLYSLLTTGERQSN